jgi:hypothetical protein
VKHPFRIKHKATGLYYCPARPIKVQHEELSGYVVSNLSKKGKVYFTDPRKHIDCVEDHTQIQRLVSYPGIASTPLKASPDDFEIEPIKFD